MSELMKKYKNTIIPQLKKELDSLNDLEVPKVLKIAINTGVGRRDEKEKEMIQKDLELIVGQKVVPRKARKSIATFKSREGMVIGFGVTLRARRMYDFLERLIMIVIPRVRDFRGIDPNSVDASGNLTLGFKEHMVFPEMIDEDIKTHFGLEVTLVTQARSREEAVALLKAFGIPFKR
ncbi:50S ribosomal protein L5 [Patescibacteria group bacterium]|nr:50S ribosomal protein L5 [Patescibacteria group bacterium]